VHTTKPRVLLRGCRFVVTMDDGRILEKVDILLEDGIIKEIAERIDEKDDVVVNCSDYVVMPGLVNCHTHAAMVLLRGYYDDAELHVWLNKMWEVESRLTPDIVYLASKLAILEMISTGTTAFVDMYFFPQATAKAAMEMGIRAYLGPPFIDIILDRKEVMKELESFIKQYEKHELIRPIVNVHSIYTCDEETLLAAGELSNRYDLLYHIHISETRKEVFECKKKHGVFPVEYLDRLGVLSERTLLVHLGWVTSWEIELIRERKAKVVHCPTSNMKLATAGFFPLKEMLAQGVAVGLGTDGPASNNSLDMFREMKTCVLLQRNNYWRTDVGAYDALLMATAEASKILGIRTGMIRRGHLADLVLLNSKSLRMMPLRKDNLVSNMVYSATGGNVVMTIVNGRIVYDRSRHEELLEEAIRISERLNNFIAKGH